MPNPKPPIPQDKATPLFIAAQNGHEDVCRALLTAGACVDRARLDRATPLWIAAQCGHDHVVRLLLAAGAYVDQLRQVNCKLNLTIDI